MASLEALRAANAVRSRIDRVNAREVARKAMLEPGDDSVHVLETPAVAVGGLPTARVPEAATVRAGKTSIDVMAAASTRVVAASTGVMVVGAKQRHDQLDRKKQFFPSAVIDGIMPYGSAGLELKVPRRKLFGDEGPDGDAAHQAAMEHFSVKEFGSTHVQMRVM